jgi:hypothetical protein
MLSCKHHNIIMLAWHVIMITCYNIFSWKTSHTDKMCRFRAESPGEWSALWWGQPWALTHQVHHPPTRGQQRIHEDDGGQVQARITRQKWVSIVVVAFKRTVSWYIKYGKISIWDGCLYASKILTTSLLEPSEEHVDFMRSDLKGQSHEKNGKMRVWGISLSPY